MAVQTSTLINLDNDEDGAQEQDFSSFVDLFECPTETVCEFGNVTFMVDDGFHPPQKIKVSSCILASSSKVFTAMFSKNYLEGQNLSSRQAEVAIKDAPRPLLAMCRMLHLKPVDAIMSANDILDLALVIDKYDCIEALRPATWALLTQSAQRQQGRCVPSSDCYATASYLLDHADLFREHTKNLVYSCTSMKDLDSRCVELLPTRVPYILTAQQTFLRHLYTSSITTILSDFTSAAYPAEKPGLTRVVMADMRTLSIWPIDLSHRSIKSLLFNLSRLQLPVLEAAPDQPCPRFSSSPARRYSGASWVPRPASPPPPIHEQISSGSGHVDESRDWDDRSFVPPNHLTIAITVEALKSHCVGICLDCIKGNENCRTPHPKPWQEWQWSMQKGWTEIGGWGDSVDDTERVPHEWENYW